MLLAVASAVSVAALAAFVPRARASEATQHQSCQRKGEGGMECVASPAAPRLLLTSNGLTTPAMKVRATTLHMLLVRSVPVQLSGHCSLSFPLNANSTQLNN